MSRVVDFVRAAIRASDVVDLGDAAWRAMMTRLEHFGHALSDPPAGAIAPRCAVALLHEVDNLVETISVGLHGFSLEVVVPVPEVRSPAPDPKLFPADDMDAFEQRCLAGLLLRAGEVARLVGVSPEAIRVAANSGRLRVVKHSPRLGRLFEPADVERFIAQRSPIPRGPRPKVPRAAVAVAVPEEETDVELERELLEEMPDSTPDAGSHAYTVRVRPDLKDPTFEQHFGADTFDEAQAIARVQRRPGALVSIDHRQEGTAAA